MKRFILFIIIFVFSLSLIGCLTIETKEYSFKLKKGTSGEGTIKYINIMRTDDSASTIENDYDELVNTYLKGNKPEDEMSGIKNVKKRLFEEDNQLCGEITFEFDDIRSLRFYSYNNEAWCYYIPAVTLFGSNETFFSSNGTYGGENMPVIFWDDKEKSFEFKTTVSESSKNKTKLLDIWKSKGGIKN
jgi:hypothetical protein